MNSTFEYREAAAAYQQSCAQFLSENAIRSLLEEARAGTDPQHMEVLLCVLDLSLPELTDPAKECVLDFLYDMLSHSDGEVRRQAASLAGKLLAGYDPSVWKAFLRRCLFSGVLMPQRQRRWVGFALKYVLTSLLAHTEGPKQRDMLRALTEYYKSTRWDQLTCFFLMDCASKIPYALCNDTQRKMLLGYARYFLSSPDRELCCAALIFTDYWLVEGAGAGLNLEPYYDLFSRVSEEDPAPGMRILAARVMHANEETASVLPDELFHQLLLENRSLQQPWIIKQVNLRILRHDLNNSGSPGNDSIRRQQYASSLLNMLQFSNHIVNRLQAEEDLTALLPFLPETAAFDAAMELIHAIETGDKNVFRYVPACLANLYLRVSFENRAALEKRLRDLIDSPYDRIVIAGLQTVVSILALAPEETQDLLGALCRGLAHHHPRIALYSLYLTGQKLYASPDLTEARKQICHSFLEKKIPCLMNRGTGRYSVFCHTAAFTGILSFLDTCTEAPAGTAQEAPEKIAFFPGAFDPFSLGNRAVVQKITEMGFSVYLAADEFSWSRRVCPLRIRQRIIAMSVADIRNAYLFPEDEQINLANPGDLKRLRQLFAGKEVYLVAGSDVVENASAYKMPPQECSVHSFKHILFSRNMNLAYEAGEKLKETLPEESILLKLPSFYEHMSASRIRENVYHGKEITDLVVPCVQNYIYENNLYAAGAGETMRKRAPLVRPVSITRSEDPKTGEQKLETCTAKDTMRAADLASAEESLQIPENRIEGSIRFRKNEKTAVITGIWNLSGEGFGGALTVMEEFLMHCMEEGILRIVFEGEEKEKWKELLSMFGFVPTADRTGYEVSLENSIVLFSDTGYVIRKDYISAASVRKAVHQAQMRLLKAAGQLRPGHAVFRIEGETLSYKLMKLVLAANPAKLQPHTSRMLGDLTCVPIGRLFKNTVIPGCVTKDLYIEMQYSEDLLSNHISEAAGYAPLLSQARMIRSFMRPVMLIDDIYSLDQNGQAVSSLFSREHADVEAFIVGIHTGNVSSDGTDQDASRIRAVCRIPDAALILTESELYPFIGGMSVSAGERSYATPSVNPILPYQFPPAQKETGAEPFFHFSEVCLENTRDILLALEEEYLHKNGSRLTMLRLREVFQEVRIPDCLPADTSFTNETPSSLLRQELKKLNRLAPF